MNDNIKLLVSYQSDSGILATIEDSGTGYNVSTLNPEQFSLHGRGIALVRQLSEFIEINDKGNQVSVILKD